ncbi:MAG TPA: endolytic transglycosylase MltG [Streptosporangiaceae bacterium]|nr:endolytic transglycosylase MltG [Streptosporangiaceae bacterium]
MSENGATWPPAPPGPRAPRTPQGTQGLPRPLPPGYEPVHHEPRAADPRFAEPGRDEDSPWRRTQRQSRPETSGWHQGGPVPLSYGGDPRDPGAREFYSPGPHGNPDPRTPENPGDQYSGTDPRTPRTPKTPENPYGQYEDDDRYDTSDRFVPGFADYGDAGDQGGRGSRRKAARRSAARGQRPGRSRRRRFRWIAPLAALLVILVPIGVGGGYVYSFYMSKYHPADYSGPGAGSIVVQVPANANPTSFGPTLAQLGVVASARAFVLAAEHSSSPNGMLPGFYGMRKHMQASLAYALLIDPKNLVQVPVTIPEGLRLSQVVAVLGKKSGLAASAFDQALKDPAQLHLPAYAGGKAEGYLFPATYDVQPHETALGVLAGMVQRFDQEAAAVNLPAAARQVHLTEGQVIIMASLVQAEGGRLSDYPKIARVIYNRLHQDIPLQLDSTVLYGLNAYGILASDAQLSSNSPYNTYRHKGLTPGPIDSPGAAAIQAVLNPAPGNWLYFVTVNPKTHETLFTSSQAQFEQFEQELRHNLGQG